MRLARLMAISDVTGVWLATGLETTVSVPSMTESANLKSRHPPTSA
jgi:hypothetical protein